MYNYDTQRRNLFTDEGQRMFLEIRDRTKELLAKAGALRFSEATRGISGDLWDLLACFDRMIELGEIRELTDKNIAGQCRVFVDA